MAKTSYPPPIDQLLTNGEPEGSGLEDWPNYLERGLGPEHIDDLIRLATDQEVRWGGEDEEALEIWGPVHAWRALGQLRAKAAIEPLTPLFETKEYDEWAMEELPQVYALLGPAAIPALTAYIDNALDHSADTRISAVTSLEAIGRRWPEARAACLASLTGQLELFAETDPEVNGFLINALIELEAVEAAPLIERAFAAKSVDLLIVGDWDDVQIELGLKPSPEVPEEAISRPFAPPVDHPPIEQRITIMPPEKIRQQHHAAKKAKLKQAKAARKKNRKRK